MAQPTRVVVFPLKARTQFSSCEFCTDWLRQVPFDSMDEISWRIVAPLGYIWDFNTADFLYRRQERDFTIAKGIDFIHKFIHYLHHLHGDYEWIMWDLTKSIQTAFPCSIWA